MQTLLPFFGVIQVSGDDRHDFLHKQLSNDIHHLAENQACYATYNTAKGRVIANMVVANWADKIMLILAADLAETVVKRLKMFVLRAKVELTILTDWGVAGCLKENIHAIMPSTPQLQFDVNESGDILLPHSGSLKLAPKSALPHHDITAELAWNQHEILSGYPWICAATSETCVAQMLNQHTIGGIHFRKGCYPGQEIIARAQYRGQVKRGLAIVRSPHALVVGTAIQDGSGAEAGLVLNVADHHCLVVLKHGAITEPLYDVSGNTLALEHCFFEFNQPE